VRGIGEIISEDYFGFKQKVECPLFLFRPGTFPDQLARREVLENAGKCSCSEEPHFFLAKLTHLLNKCRSVTESSAPRSLSRNSMRGE